MLSAHLKLAMRAYKYHNPFNPNGLTNETTISNCQEKFFFLRDLPYIGRQMYGLTFIVDPEALSRIERLNIQEVCKINILPA